MTAYKEITQYACVCERCKWKWVTRAKKLPKVCPKCKRSDWQTKKAGKTGGRPKGK
jgi:hypothetical protein